MNLYRQLILLSLLINACASIPKGYDTLFYTDQNNNRFVVTQNTLAYTAVSKQMSSTGNYSGGINYQTSMTANDFNKLIKQAEALLNDTSQHSDTRIKTTSVLELRGAKHSKTAVLLPSDERLAFEDLLTSFR